jgi:hypothetical protein
MSKQEVSLSSKYTKWELFKVDANGKVITEVVDSEPLTTEQALKKYKVNAVQALIS